MFVIRGDKGTQFISCTNDKSLNQEVVYETFEEAEKSLTDIQATFNHEQFEIKEI